MDNPLKQSLRKTLFNGTTAKKLLIKNVIGAVTVLVILYAILSQSTILLYQTDALKISITIALFYFLGGGFMMTSISSLFKKIIDEEC